jgi:spore coat polysaccharide biosynthesis protein SpsF
VAGRYHTEQEAFWAGAFGDDYVARNQGEALLAANTALFARLLARAGAVGSVLELGANIGLNLVALRRLLPAAELAAVEINASAVDRLRRLEGVSVHHGSLLDFEPERTWDLVFTKGVLIHLAPEALDRAYEVLVRASARLVAVVEYYNPVPVEVPYRGHAGRLFKRDFAGELLDRHRDFELVDYGFAYHRDRLCPQDDVTWFLLRRATAPGPG